MLISQLDYFALEHVVVFFFFLKYILFMPKCSGFIIFSQLNGF